MQKMPSFMLNIFSGPFIMLQTNCITANWSARLLVAANWGQRLCLIPIIIWTFSCRFSDLSSLRTESSLVCNLFCLSNTFGETRREVIAVLEIYCYFCSHTQHLKSAPESKRLSMIEWTTDSWTMSWLIMRLTYSQLLSLCHVASVGQWFLGDNSDSETFRFMIGMNMYRGLQ